MPLQDLLRPARLWTPGELLAKPSPIPAERGLYAWYVRSLPAPTRQCHSLDGYPLVYIGIAPSRAGSKATLRSRIRQHLRGNSSASTLRLSLGCLLADTLGIRLQPVGGRLTFADGEALLSEWLEANARVAWTLHDEPWVAEPGLIRKLDLPLNLEHNERHAFHPRLSALRSEARRQARDAASGTEPK